MPFLDQGRCAVDLGIAPPGRMVRVTQVQRARAGPKAKERAADNGGDHRAGYADGVARAELRILPGRPFRRVALGQPQHCRARVDRRARPGEVRGDNGGRIRPVATDQFLALHLAPWPAAVPAKPQAGDAVAHAVPATPERGGYVVGRGIGGEHGTQRFGLGRRPGFAPEPHFGKGAGAGGHEPRAGDQFDKEGGVVAVRVAGHDRPTTGTSLTRARSRA